MLCTPGHGAHEASAQEGDLQQLCDEQHAPQQAVLACGCYLASAVELPQAAGLIALSDGVSSPHQVHQCSTSANRR